MKKLLAAILLLTVAGLALYSLQPAPKPHLEVLRSELVLTNDRLFAKSASQPFTGLMIENYPSGQRQSRSAIKDGLLDGLSEGWHTNGVLQVQEHFIKGVSDGIRVKWNENGQKKSEATIVNGKLHGPFRRWHENGELAEDVQMNQGEPDGISKAYFPSGFLKAEANLKNGQILTQKFWKDGELRPPSEKQK